MNETKDKALLVAIMALQKQIADLPFAIVMNMAKSPQQIMEERYYRLIDEKEREQKAKDDEAERKKKQEEAERKKQEQESSFANQIKSKTLGNVNEGAKALGLAFGKLLGPLASLSAVLSAPTSGLSLFNKALEVFAATIAPIVMPVLFTFATALVAVSDTIWRRLSPALDGWYKLLLTGGISAVQNFIDVVGRAADALKAISESKVGKAAGLPQLFDNDTGGFWGAVNRLTGGGSVESDKTTAGTIKRVERAGLDAIETWVPIWGGRISRGTVSIAKGIFGDEVDPYRGIGTRRSGGATESAETTRQARLKTLQELLLSQGPRATIGDLSGVYRNAQLSSANTSPFQRDIQEKLRRVIDLLEKNSPDAEGAFTSLPVDIRGRR